MIVSGPCSDLEAQSSPCHSYDGKGFVGRRNEMSFDPEFKMYKAVRLI